MGQRRVGVWSSVPRTTRPGTGTRGRALVAGTLACHEISRSWIAIDQAIKSFVSSSRSAELSPVDFEIHCHVLRHALGSIGDNTSLDARHSVNIYLTDDGALIQFRRQVYQRDWSNWYWSLRLVSLIKSQSYWNSKMLMRSNKM